MKYYLRTNNGTKNPTFVHATIVSARKEAHRLLDNGYCQKVEILAVVLDIERQKITTIEFKEENYKLPF